MTRRRQIGFPAILGLSVEPTEALVPSTTLSVSADVQSPLHTLAQPTNQTSLTTDSETEQMDRARLYTKKARDMTETYGLELRSLDDEMQELTKDLLDLKDHVTAVRPQLMDN